jgi:hypothetical protein
MPLSLVSTKPWELHLAVAERFGIGEAKDIIKDARRTISQWSDFAEVAGLNSKDIERIAKHHLSLK